MNISTGGPHILLFERDQQLAELLTSEFQLAGHECHTARTAVEVFDAIARQPIRIVLVNLAQAAAARREFWVALDTQRRGRGIQVFTFRCTNLAGYGPQDLDERSQPAPTDLEIDGMLGVISFVDTIRMRLGGSVSTTSQTTSPRLPGASLSQSIPTTPSAPVQRPSQLAQNTQPSIPSAHSSTGHSGGRGSAMYSPETTRTNTGAFSQPSVNMTSAPPHSSGGPNAATSHNPQQYSEKIRAVLYPNQRTWTTPNNTAIVFNQESKPSAPTYDTQQSFNASTVLQRLASGQIETEGAGESGLAQLSRMVQEHFVPTTQPGSSEPNIHVAREIPTVNGPERPSPLASTTYHGNSNQQIYHPQEVIPPARIQPNENFSTQTLRASPIQDIPLERGTSGQTGPLENPRRPDVLSRTYGQQATSQVQTSTTSSLSTSSLSSLASIAAQMLTTTHPGGNASPIVKEVLEEEERETDPAAVLPQTPLPTMHPTEQGSEKLSKEEKEIREVRISVPPEPQKPQEQETLMEEDINSNPQNVVLLNIMQSLPPMPAAPPRPPLPQILIGRATRSLGSVLLEGHLVPQSRLEVAQHVQRMLRGVDLNYQLGEILLMFKLLTPDQLLAASLVSYGMITTTQISSLGRIRQELHSIGLDYDLENLLIMFRILTPEQLREVKSSWQG